MDAYEPLNLSGICNAGPELPGERSGVTAGVRHDQGLPFLIGRDDAKASPCLLGFGNGFPDQPESIPVRKTALRVIVAHRLLDSRIPDNGPIGEGVAEYRSETARYMLTLVDGCISYMQQNSRQHRPGEVTHHHGEQDHMAYLERPFLEAREAIHRRMHRYGIRH